MAQKVLQHWPRKFERPRFYLKVPQLRKTLFSADHHFKIGLFSVKALRYQFYTLFFFVIDGGAENLKCISLRSFTWVL